ncbi:putative lipase/serine esterase [Myriangium duriaei CBS 260.36]|uniref:Lipase/serine esterase n=1 Tax=Myriangium duriaei CBS 260.36 TaxID=1168546 RepID=A0A9P4J1V3_9PEZI|nr:putative lipase/serine esterase [Myriangium duriaei CBS 260.36]
MESSSGKADHLVVLIHGLWGNPSHLEYLVNALRKAFTEDQLHILVPKSNSNNFTYDGIETGGERITHEIEDHIKKLEEKGSTISKISMIGYSLGGLLARYAIGLLHSSGLFDRIQPVNFTTFATPHLGVRTPLTGTASRLWNVLGAHTLSTSGRQLFLIDKFKDTGRPLLSVMADRNSIFIKGLSSFQHRTLYANILNDRSVVYYTAAIDSTDPYVDLSKVALNAIPGTEGILLDPSDPVGQKKQVKVPLLQRITDGAVYTVTSIPFFFFLTCLLPFGATYFLANAGIQSFRSARRVELHDSGKAGISVEKYRKTPYLIEEMRNVADKVYRHAAASSGEEYLPTPPPEESEHHRLMGSISNSSSTLVADETAASKKPGQTEVHKHGHDEFPTLALTDEQFEMISALDEVGFTKYRVHISSVRHTHAAIIVRIPWRPGFGQGKIVVNHWIEGFVI